MSHKKRVMPLKNAKKAIEKLEETLEQKASKAELPHNEKEVIEELIGELKVSDNYKKIEKKAKKEDLDEKEAADLGFKPDNYYTAKDKEDMEDELGEFEETSGSLGSRRSSRS